MESNINKTDSIIILKTLIIESSIYKIFHAKENYIDKMHTYKVWYVHQKWVDICLTFMFKRHIHLKWIQELFLAWLGLASHERLNLYERCIAI